MRIAILGSVALPVPPPRQGGTEWIAYYQAKGLSSLGHQVLLFAAKDSLSDGYRLIKVGGGDTASTIQESREFFKESVEASRKLRKENVYLAEVIQKLIDLKDDYDVILNNMRGEAVFLPLAKLLHKPFFNVMHLPLFADLVKLFNRYKTHVITISNAQRKGYPDLNYSATIYNCVDTDKFTYKPKPDPPDGEDYLMMMGTIGEHKNQAAAIRVAQKLGMRLILAGKVRDKDYFSKLIKDIDGKQIHWHEELDTDEKVKLYQNAKAFLFPIVWQEPFGLVMIEAMACGTPVVAFANGAIPEVVVDGKTGFVIDGNDENKMVEAVGKIKEIKREDCRNHVEENFTVEKMVAGYEEALKSIT